LLLCNCLYFIFNLSSEITFRKSLKNPLKTQQRILKTILRRNSKTIFGIRYSFNQISAIKVYQEEVPVTEYEDYLSYIGLIKDGEIKVLTREPVTRFCLSSGTSSSSKLIPFNSRLKREFQNAIAVWLNNIIRNYPSILSGRSFWIISPIAEADYQESMVPIGFEDDSSYFGAVKKRLIRKVMAVPDEVSHLTDSENYYYALSWFLLKEKNLRLISVWNPLVLLNICRKIIRYNKELIADIEQGSMTFPEKIPEHLEMVFKKYAAPRPREAIRLNQIFKDVDENSSIIPFSCNVWPKLTLISCWTDSWASGFISEIEKYFPGIPVQGKGLLATEAVITIPVKFKNIPAAYNLPAINSHFLEFRSLDDQKISLIDQLAKGAKYEVIVTTGGGFYRYSLHDIVEVSGYYKNVPILKFLGKSDLVCDITGEKLNEIHVASVIERVEREFGLKSSFRFVTPQITNGIPVYVLMIENIDHPILMDFQNKITGRLDELLFENYHYKNSRKLLQLGLPRIFEMNNGANELFIRIKSTHSLQGTLKIYSLDYSNDWTHLLPGYFIN
jgi:hypothetical protein